MSFPNIPNVTPMISVTVGQTIPLLLASIAFEELALAHIVNAEAEKIQFVLGTLSPSRPLASTSATPTVTLSNILDFNRSVNQTLQTVIKKEMLLQFKLENIFEQLPVLIPPVTPPTPPPSAVCDCQVSFIVPNRPTTLTVDSETPIPGLARIARAGAPNGRVRICHSCDPTRTELFDLTFTPTDTSIQPVTFSAESYDLTPSGTVGTCCTEANGSIRFTITGTGTKTDSSGTQDVDFQLVLVNGSSPNTDSATLTLIGNDTETFVTNNLATGNVHVTSCSDTPPPPCTT